MLQVRPTSTWFLTNISIPRWTAHPSSLYQMCLARGGNTFVQWASQVKALPPRQHGNVFNFKKWEFESCTIPPFLVRLHLTGSASLLQQGVFSAWVVFEIEHTFCLLLAALRHAPKVRVTV